MLEVLCKFGAAILQMELDMWSGVIVSSVLRNTDRYHQGGVSLTPNLLTALSMCFAPKLFKFSKDYWKSSVV